MSSWVIGGVDCIIAASAFIVNALVSPYLSSVFIVNERFFTPSMGHQGQSGIKH
jgi:hypothetical protein